MSKLPYWERRKAQLMVDQMGKAEAFADELALAYDQASRYLQGQTDKIFDKFRRDYGLTEQQARQILKQAGQLDNLNDLKQVLAAQPDDSNIQRLLADLDSPAYAHRIEQLERTQRQAIEIVKALAGAETRRSEEFYAGLVEDSFHRSTFELQQQSGLAYHFNGPSEAEISSLLRSRWEGGSFSSRIWNNTQSLSQGLKTELLVSLLSGRSDRETAEAIAKRFEAGKYNSRRLVRTESAFFHGQMELKSYEEADVEWYRFVAVLDLRTSSKCQHQDGKTYKVSEAVTGVTYPPLHPWCRSTTIASDDKEWLSKLERRARDPETGKNILVPGDMTYKEWYAKYVEKKSLEKVPGKVYNQGMEGMHRKKNIDQNKMSVASQEQINRLSRKFRRRGGEFIDDEDAIAYLDEKHAEAITLDAYTILKRRDISISALIEELEHAEQYLRGENDGTALSVAINEVNAKRKSIEERERYKLPKIEIDSVRRDIKYYQKEIERLQNENS